MKQMLAHARLFDGGQFHAGRAVTIDDGRIDAILDMTAAVGGYAFHDLTGLVLAPGFIDLQVNGGGGIMLNGETSLEGLALIADAHRAFGTTGMLPTLISDQWQAMDACG